MCRRLELSSSLAILAHVYSAWFEWFTENDESPAYVFQVTIENFSVQAGDEIFASVQYIVEAFGYLYMANLTSGQHFVMVLAPPPNASFKGNTVEWIMEVPGEKRRTRFGTSRLWFSRVRSRAAPMTCSEIPCRRTLSTSKPQRSRS